MRAPRNDLTAERVRHIFNYDPLTGILVWKNPPRRLERTGKPAGGVGSGNRKIVMVDGAQRNYARIVWLHYYGEYPVGVVDHINGNPLDNRIENLRDVSQSHNTMISRRPCRSKSGEFGVKPRRNKWIARIYVAGHDHYLGTFTTKDSAAAARRAAELAFFGELRPRGHVNASRG